MIQKSHFGVYIWKEMQLLSNICIPIEAFFIVAKVRKQAKCPWRDG